jgi:hypothetical protein
LGVLWGFWSFSNALRTHFQPVTLEAFAVGAGFAILGAGWLVYFCQRETAKWFDPGFRQQFAEDGSSPVTLNLSGNVELRPEPPPVERFY